MKKILLIFTIFIITLLASCAPDNRPYIYADINFEQENTIIYSASRIENQDTSFIGVMRGKENYDLSEIISDELYKKGLINENGSISASNFIKNDDLLYMSISFKNPTTSQNDKAFISLDVNTFDVSILEIIDNSKKVRNIYDNEKIFVVQGYVNEKYEYDFYDFINNKSYSLKCDTEYDNITYVDGYFVEYKVTDDLTNRIKKFDIRVYDYELNVKSVSFETEFKSNSSEFYFKTVTEKNIIVNGYNSFYCNVDLETGEMLPDNYVYKKEEIFTYDYNNKGYDVKLYDNKFRIEKDSIIKQIKHLENMEKKFKDINVVYSIYGITYINDSLYVYLGYGEDYYGWETIVSAPIIIVKYLGDDKYEYTGYIPCTEGKIIDIVEID